MLQFTGGIQRLALLDMPQFEDQEFVGVNYQEAPLEAGKYEYCLFRNCSFAGIDLSKFRFLETEFIDCDFSNITVLETGFQDVIFRSCKLLGIRFEDCQTFGFAVHFIDCQLDHATFFECDLRQCNFEHCQLHSVDFTRADLREVSLQDCDFARATFERTQLQKADLRGSIRYHIDPELNGVRGAKFTLPAALGLLAKYGVVIE